MIISERLKTIAGCVDNCDFLVDVGTDHAYIPIYLVEKKIVKNAIACDISKGSVEKAEKNIKLHNYCDVIETRLGDGLSVIKEYEKPDQIIIAGMGGMLTIDILKNSPNVVKSAKKLILQPQRDIDKVRKVVHTFGFKIVCEKMLFEDGKYYNVFVCEKGLDFEYTERDYFFGKLLLESNNPVLKNQVAFELNKIKNVIDGMNKKILAGKNDDLFLERFAQLNEKRKLYESVHIN